MLTLNMTPGNDADTIWIIIIEGDSATYRLASDNITLSGNYYDGAVLKVNQRGDEITNVKKENDFSRGGGIGILGSFSFSIARFNNNADFKDFFNSWYPATGKPYLTSRRVSLGVVWQGATLESQITWLEKGYINSYQYDARTLYFDCYDQEDIEIKSLPFYKIQKDYNNGISYFPSAPKENYGLPIPIVYGSFTKIDWATNDFSLSPCLQTNKGKSSYIIASHKCFSTSKGFKVANENIICKYINTLKSYELIYKNTGTAETNTISHTITLQNVLDKIYGEIKILFTEVSSYNTVSDAENAVDFNNGGLAPTYANLSINDKLALRLGVTLDEASLGKLNQAANDVSIKFNGTQPAGSILGFDWVINYNDDTTDPPSSGSGVTGSEAAIWSGELVWNIGALNLELTHLGALDYHLTNNGGGQVQINYGYLHLQNIIVGEK